MSVHNILLIIAGAIGIFIVTGIIGYIAHNPERTEQERTLVTLRVFLIVAIIALLVYIVPRVALFTGLMELISNMMRS